MKLTQIFQALGEEGFRETLGSISIGKLKTYRLYDSMKARAHLPKLNVQGLRKVTPRFWARIGEDDQDLASDLAQAVLVSNLDMIIEVLDSLGIEHNDGFFDKDTDASKTLADDWRRTTFEKFRGKYSEPLLIFYLNRLAWEVAKAEDLFTPNGAD